MESIKSCSIAPTDHQDRQLEDEVEAHIFSICARAGVCCIGIQRGFGHAPDFVLFQPTVTTLAVPLSAFASPDEAIAAIKAKLAQSGFDGGAE
jgi:hypothetical protein